MTFTIESVLNTGNDVLLITATDDQGGQVTATGWVSATENFYDAKAYDSDGNLNDAAQPRAMTAAEVGAYAQRLLAEQNPDMIAQPEPTPIAFA